ncbi:unnamed protein product [Ilex paraguariensis]|uniref:Rho-GAP domain-containing protein n=1 Tax=Ilex paraguariensis TaxID=185542 RepID=A0ABC8TJ76_9AQUA
MQCSFDERGNSVPTVLLMMQKRLYLEGGLQEEGIFRINAENSQEEYVRNQLNKGVLPRGIDIHCLGGLIKAYLCKSSLLPGRKALLEFWSSLASSSKDVPSPRNYGS